VKDKSALYKHHYGLYIISSSDGTSHAGCVINTATQVTSDPVQIMVAVNKQNATCGLIQETRHFALTIVDETADMDFIARFGFRTSTDYDKYAGIETRKDEFGDPWTPLHAAAMESAVVKVGIDAGSHMLFVAEVVEAENLSDVNPMSYSYYHNVLKGKTPPKASAYNADDAAPGLDGPAPTPAQGEADEKAEKGEPVGKMHHFKCMLCGYIVEMDAEELPPDFTCPLCGAGAQNFVKID
jgi:flavin reductase (DIM6/NTAB) family NADH-FMN oxidoreductase RutF/rubredoxin